MTNTKTASEKKYYLHLPNVPDPPGEPIVLMKFGSHLYGTDTPESDVDYKGVFLPSKRSMLLGRIPKVVSHSTGDNDSKNAAGDLDVEWFSLHQFMKLACEGQTLALDMLNCPYKWEEDMRDGYKFGVHDIWVDLKLKHQKFYTRNLKAFVGYCRQQAAKYGIKGSRLNVVKEAVALARKIAWGNALHNEEHRVSEAKFPVGEHSRWINDDQGRTFYEICGRKFEGHLHVEQMIGPLEKFLSNYGERAELAAKNEGIDWKAVSHALRAGYELEEIYDYGRIEFPLRSAAYLKLVKSGQLDYLSEVAPELERIIEVVGHLADRGSYPDKVDREYWDNWMETSLQDYFSGNWDD